MAYPTPYIELPDDEFDYEDDWKELVDNTAPGGGATLSNDGQEATLVGLIPWNKQRSCLRYFVGYNYAEAVGGVQQLRREQPAAHPVWPFLRAASVNFTPYVLKANTDNDNNSPWVTSPFDETSYTAYYDKALATVRYRNWRCSFLGDSQISEGKYEWKRNCVFDGVPKVEALSADGNIANLYWAETAAGGPTVNKAIPVPIFTLLAKFGLRITWLNVPVEYVSTEAGGGSEYYVFPAQILNCLGHVNDAEWLDGIPAGCAFLEAVGVAEKTAPVASNDLAVPLRYCDIMLDLSYFNPEKGVSGSTYRGHNLMPWRQDIKWYYATRNGTTSGKPLYTPVDFDQIFEGVVV